MNTEIVGLLIFFFFAIGVPLFGYWDHILEERDKFQVRDFDKQLEIMSSNKKETQYDKNNLYDLNNKRFYRIMMADGEYIEVYEEDFWTDFEKMKNKKSGLNDLMNNKFDNKYLNLQNKK